MGLRIVCSEVVNGGTVRLTHLDLGNTQLQLVEPLTPEHPLRCVAGEERTRPAPFLFQGDRRWRLARGVLAAGLVPATPPPHQGTEGKRALFLAKGPTQDVQVEITGA